MLTKRATLVFFYFGSLFIYSDSLPRWSWGRLAQIEPVVRNGCSKGQCVEKWKCQLILIVNNSSEECVQQRGSFWTCCLSSSDLPMNLEYFDDSKNLKLFTSGPVIESYSSFESSTVKNSILTPQENKSWENKNNFRDERISSIYKTNEESLTQHFLKSLNSGEDYVDSFGDGTGYVDVENNTSGKIANYMTYTSQKRPQTNGFFKYDEFPFRDNWNVRHTKNDYPIPSEYSREEPLDRAWSSNPKHEPSQNFSGSRNTKVPSYPSFNANYPFRRGSKSTTSFMSSTTKFNKATKSPWFNEPTSLEQKRTSKFGNPKTTAYQIKPTKTTLKNPFSSIFKTSKDFSSESTNTQKNTVKPLTIRNSPSGYSTEKTYGSKITPFSRKQTTKSSWNNYSREYSKSSTKALENKTSSRKRTTKPNWSSPTTKALTKPTKSLNRASSTISRKKTTETWRTNTLSNSQTKSSTSEVYSFTTARPKKSTYRSTLPTKKTTLSNRRTINGKSEPDKNTLFSKVTKSTFNTRHINSPKITTVTPLPDISKGICGLRITEVEENDDKDASIKYPESREGNSGRQRFQRIVGGKEAEPLSWPWVAALYKVSPSGGNRFLCAGTLINEYFVLTAAHVFTPENLKSSFVAMLGTHTGKEAVGEYTVMNVLQHPQYDQRYYYNDIALLRLERPVKFSEFVMPVCLPSPETPFFRDEDLLGKKVTVMGWGDESFGGVTSRVLKEASFPVQSRRSCNASYFQVVSQRFPRGITHEMLCAGSPNGGKDACQGDSGGPLTTIAFGRYTQVGIVSFGYRCGDKDYPGVYTKVSSYLSWIAENSNCDDYDYDYYSRD